MDIRLEIRNRIRNVRRDMEKEGINAILISNPKNILYMTGKGTGMILLTEEKATLWVKDLYRDLYSDLYDGNYEFDVRIYDKNSLKGYIEKEGLSELGIENLSLERYEKLDKLDIDLKRNNIIERNRAVKSDYEIELLKKAADIAKKGMEKAYEVVHSGVKEMDAVSEIEYTIRKLGSENPPFGDGMLLASGKNSADVHAKAGMDKIPGNELTVVDLGAVYSGYHSDMTRTICTGKMDKNQQDIFEFVKNLEMETIDMVEIGICAGDIHSFAENKIREKGYQFYHSTGHGVGLDIHELPNIGPESQDILTEGMVFTIEPGIYIPGKFGVRFEDTLLLKKSGVEILTK